MTKKNWFLIIALLVLSTVYACCFTDWFKTKVIVIRHTSRMIRQRPGDSPDTVPVLFGLNNLYRLTEIKVVPLLAWQTNQNSMPVWHLISDSNSVPIKGFSYGQRIKGMRPALPGTQPEPLEPAVTYHLILAAGKIKGEHDFEAKPNAPAASP
jgi:hypothetical protein